VAGCLCTRRNRGIEDEEKGREKMSEKTREEVFAELKHIFDPLLKSQ